MEKGNAKKAMERVESRKIHSWWWESHVNPKNAKWLANSLEEMDQNTQKMVRLIEDDGDSFAKRAEMYYKRRPQLISNVQEFQRMYRALAERYAQLTGDLQKNVLTDLGSDPKSPWFSADLKLNPFKPTRRPRGFDYFLGSVSDRHARDGASSLSDSGESDISSVQNEEALHEKTIQMDTELYGDKEKLGMHQQDSSDLIELQLKVASYEEEIANLKRELEIFKPVDQMDQFDVKQVEAVEEMELSDPEKVRAVFEELKLIKGRFNDLQTISLKLSTENKLARENIHQLQDQLKEAEKDAAVLKSNLDLETKKGSKWQDKIARYKNNLKHRYAEIIDHKETTPDANEKHQTEEKLLEIQHEEAEKKLRDETEQLRAEMAEKREQLGVMSRDLTDLKLKCGGLMRERDVFKGQLLECMADAGNDVKLIMHVKELQEEIEKQRVVILEGEEEKREAIRQLCFSLEHYRKGYQQIRHKGLAVAAS